MHQLHIHVLNLEREEEGLLKERCRRARRAEVQGAGTLPHPRFRPPEHRHPKLPAWQDGEALQDQYRLRHGEPHQAGA